jgi:thiol-disulfide isomerase/thioredoxin
MQACRKMSTVCFVALIVTSSFTASLAADQADDFLRFLEARDESIASYEIKLRQISFDIALDDYKAFKKNIEEMAKDEPRGQSPLQQAEQLIQTWAKEPHWLERHTKQRGERFKETIVFNSGSTTITSYDGRLYYRYVADNRQLDIHAKMPNIHHTNIGDLGFASGWLRRRGKILSFEQNAEGARCVILFSEDDSLTITQQYNRDFGLDREHLIDSLQQSDYSYYIFHEKIDGYSVPHLKINISPIPRRNECSVWILVIEDVQFNRPFTDEDLSLGDLPAETLVIDYRFTPSVQWHYGEYRHGAANPDAVHDGRSKPEDMLEFLKSKRLLREALATRDSRTGRKAPRPHIQQWLSKPDNLDTWPPERFTVVNFWSIGCGFCIREIPQNNELARWLKDQGALFLSVHAATNEAGDITSFMENQEMQYTVGLDESGGERGYWNSATFAEYGVNGVPEYVTIAEDGRVLSYDRSPTKEHLQELMAKEPDQIAASAKGKARQRLDVIPNGWVAGDLEPNSQVQGRFFVFRPETPDADLHELGGGGDAIDCQWTRHSSDGQTIYEVILTAKTPDWGRTLKGDVDLIARYNNVEEMVTISYKLRSRSLAGCVSDILWLGPAVKGETVSNIIALQCDPQRDVKVTAVSVPPEIQLNITENGEGRNRILVKCAFSSQESGLRRGTAQLLARDGEGNEQPLRLEYYAFVRP